MTSATARRTNSSHTSGSSLAGMCTARLSIELKQFFREREAVIFIFAFPVVMLVIFASAFSSQRDFLSGGGASIGAAQYYITGMIATGIMLTSFQNLATFIAAERDDGTLKRLRGTPMPPIAYFLGKIAEVVVTTVIQLTLLLAVASLFYGVDLPQSRALWLRFCWLVLLGAAAGTVLGIAFSSVPRSGRSASAVVTPIVIVLQFISGVYFTFGELPGLDARHRVGVPAHVDGAGHALGVPAAAAGGRGARRDLARRNGCAGARWVARHRSDLRHADVPLDPPRRRLARARSAQLSERRRDRVGSGARGEEQPQQNPCLVGMQKASVHEPSGQQVTFRPRRAVGVREHRSRARA